MEVSNAREIANDRESAAATGTSQLLEITK